MVGELLAQDLLAPGVYLDLGIRLRPLRTKTQPHPDVVGQVDLLARGARDEFGALAVIDLECDGCASHDGSPARVARRSGSDDVTSRSPDDADGRSRQALSRRARATASPAVRTPSLASRRASRSRTECTLRN